MSSFVRCIPKYEAPSYVEEILSRSDHFIPLKRRPRRAQPGDFFYLAYGGRIVGRAAIDSIAAARSDVPIASDRRLYEAEWLVKYKGAWQRPPVDISYRGHQGFRYLKVECW